jgi:hypothetical protein
MRRSWPGSWKASTILESRNGTSNHRRGPPHPALSPLGGERVAAGRERGGSWDDSWGFRRSGTWQARAAGRWLVGLAPIDPRIGPAERADLAFHLLHHPEGRASLLLTGAPANWAIHAHSRQEAVKSGGFVAAHKAWSKGSRFGESQRLPDQRQVVESCAAHVEMCHSRRSPPITIRAGETRAAARRLRSPGWPRSADNRNAGDPHSPG